MANPQVYNLPQSVFMCSLGSNALFNEIDMVPGLLQLKLHDFLAGKNPSDKGQGPFFTALNKPNSAYPCLAYPAGQTAGDWCTVWGPVVDQQVLNPGATNAMYVAYSAHMNIYVVAIAGTNPTGDTALIVEDLDVAPASMMQWPPAVSGGKLTFTGLPQPSPTPSGMQPVQPMPDPAQPFIDAGTADGIGILYAMTDSRTGQNLATFLDGVNKTGQTLAFTGHSLGGALSPTLAMLLYPQAAATPPVDPATGKWSAVFILATAGPTPGTPGFANRFFTPPAAAVIGSGQPITADNPPPAPPAAVGPYAPAPTNAAASAATWQFDYWNMNYANTNDVVPRAWNALANLVQPPAPGSDGDYPSFFGDGTPLSATGDIPPGPTTLGLVRKVMTRSGYVGDATIYYVPCLLQSPFNGSWGTWTPKATSYPPPWNASDIAMPIATMGDMVDWVLNAHLGQYSHALLGYPCPTIHDVPD